MTNDENSRYFTHGELTSALNQLLEAERTGAKVIFEIAGQLIDME
jgi:hypothetical protein